MRELRPDLQATVGLATHREEHVRSQDGGLALRAVEEHRDAALVPAQADALGPRADSDALAGKDLPDHFGDVDILA